MTMLVAIILVPASVSFAARDIVMYRVAKREFFYYCMCLRSMDDALKVQGSLASKMKLTSYSSLVVVHFRSRP